MTIKISREVLLSILMLMTCLHSLRLYLLWQIFQRLKNYLTYRVASSLTLALFFVVSASAFNPQARSLVITPLVALLFLISASAFNPQVSRDYSTKISLHLSRLTLSLFPVLCSSSASAFNPQAYLGCVPINGTLPADVDGEVCQLQLALALALALAP